MRKLRLSVQDLEVESFTVTTSSHSRRGTVQGAGGRDADAVNAGRGYAYESPNAPGDARAQTPSMYLDQLSCAAACETQPGGTCDTALSYDPCYTELGKGC